MLMKCIFYFIGFLVALCQVRALGGPLVQWFEDTPLSGGSVLKSVVFQTVPGALHRIESSDDLISWTTEDEIYGLGHPYSIPFTLINPGTATPPSPVLQGPASGLMIRPCSDPAGGYVLFLMEGGQAPISTWITDPLDPVWNQTHLSFFPFADHSFFIMISTAPADPPEVPIPENSPLVELFAAFELHLPEMTQALIDSTDNSQGGFPPPTDPDSYQFWRVVTDYTLDSDGDGSPDVLEFQIMADPSHPSYALADVTNADANGDGVDDGNNIDTDQDGTPDVQDADMEEATIDWVRLREPRFASFEVVGPAGDPSAEPPIPAEAPLQINDHGAVLFKSGVWEGGEFHSLVADSDEIEQCFAIGMNNHGNILGLGVPVEEWNGGGPIGLPPVWTLAYWPDRGSDPVAVHRLNENDDKIFPECPSHLDAHLVAVALDEENALGYPKDPLPREFPHDCLLDDSKRFLGAGEELGIWQVNPDGSFDKTSAPSEFLRFVLAPNLSWGADDNGGSILYAGTASHSFNRVIHRVAHRPGSLLTATNLTGPMQSLIGGSWQESTRAAYQSLTDVSRDLGLVNFSTQAFRVDLENGGDLDSVGIMNGDFRSFDMLAPGLGAPWGEKAGTRDLSPSGNWLWAEEEERNNRIPGLASFPVSVEDDEFATGVDYHSSMSSAVDAASDNKYWIMAPIGDSDPNEVRLFTSASASGTWLAEADGVTIGPNGNLNGAATDLSFASTLSETTDIDLTLKLTPAGGPQVSAESFPIGIKAMKKRTVRVTIWHIAKDRPNQPYVPTAFTFSKNGADDEVEDDVLNYLNDVFGKQVNTFFDVKIGVNGAWGGDPRYIQHPVVWDIWEESTSQAEEERDGVDNDPNGFFDVSTPSTPEQDAVVNAKEDTNADINVYIVGGSGNSSQFFRSWKVLGDGSVVSDDHSLFTPLGISDPDARRVWVYGGPADENLPQAEINGIKARCLKTIAHEIGHVMIGGGHPDQGKGAASLPGSPVKERLMYSRAVPERGDLLVKGEWDRIEDWLTLRELGQN